jgi:hypothetical protein
MIEKLANFFGWTTTYHVSYLIPSPSCSVYGDMTLTVRPWITADTWKVARGVVAEDNKVTPEQITIVSVTRL